MLEFLDAPRSALWNLGRGVSDLTSGDASAADLAPGLAGLALGGGLAASGVGIPLSILMGSLMGGFGQEMVGREAMRPGEFLNKYAGVDENSTGGMLGSMALSLATDPLTFAGGGFGMRPTPNMLAPIAEGRLAGMAADDLGRAATSRLDDVVGKYRGEAPTPNFQSAADQRLGEVVGKYNNITRSPFSPPYTPASPLLSGYGPEGVLMSQGQDILRGAVPAGQDLGSLSEMMRAAGMDASRMVPVMEQGASRDILERMGQQGLPSFHFKPKLNAKGAELPMAPEGYQLPIGESQVPVDPALFMEQAQRRPTLMSDLLAESTAEPGALTVRPPRIVADDVSGMRLNYESRQKRIAEALAEMLQSQQGM
jgi:hypothetical protein